MKKCSECHSTDVRIVPLANSLAYMLLKLMPNRRLPRGHYLIECNKCGHASVLIVEF